MSTQAGRLPQILVVGREHVRNSQSLGVERPLTSNEAAGLLRVHPKTIKRMAARGEVPGHFRFGRWFFYPSELDSWMKMELNSERHP